MEHRGNLLPVEPLSLIQSSDRCDMRLCQVVFPIIHCSLKLNFQVTEHPQLNGWRNSNVTINSLQFQFSLAFSVHFQYNA